MTSTGQANARNSPSDLGGRVRTIMTPVPTVQGVSAFPHLHQEQLMVPQTEFGLSVVASANPTYLRGLVAVAPMPAFNPFMNPRHRSPKPAINANQRQTLLLPPLANNASPTDSGFVDNLSVFSSSFLSQAQLKNQLTQQHSLHSLQEQSMPRQQHQNIPIQPRQNAQQEPPQPAEQVQMHPPEQLGISPYHEATHGLPQRLMEQSFLPKMGQQRHAGKSGMLRQPLAHQPNMKKPKKFVALSPLSKGQCEISTETKEEILHSSSCKTGASSEETFFAPQPSFKNEDNMSNQSQTRTADTATSVPIDAEGQSSDDVHVKSSNLYRLLEAASLLQDDAMQEIKSQDKCKAEADTMTSLSESQYGITKPRRADTDPQSSSHFGQNSPVASLSSVSSLPAKKQRSKRKKKQEVSKPACVRKVKNVTKTGAQKPKPQGREPKTARTFPQKLMDVLMNVPNDEDVVAWLPDGKSFVIIDPDQFVAKYLPHAFKKCKYMSFTRKLNRWGFVRMTSGTGTDCFHHQLFQKGRMDLCLKMLSVRGKDEAQINAARKRLEIKRKYFAANSKSGTLSGSGSKGVNKRPSLMGLDKFIKKKAVSNAAVHASSLHQSLSDKEDQVKQRQA